MPGAGWHTRHGPFFYRPQCAANGHLALASRRRAACSKGAAMAVGDPGCTGLIAGVSAGHLALCSPSRKGQQSPFGRGLCRLGQSQRRSSIGAATRLISKSNWKGNPYRAIGDCRWELARFLLATRNWFSISTVGHSLHSLLHLMDFALCVFRHTHCSSGPPN